MRSIIYSLTLTAASLFCIQPSAMAHKGDAPGGEISFKPKSLDFIENQGQWDNPSKYKVGLPGGVLFLTENGFVYNFKSQKDELRLHTLYEAGENIEKEIVNYHAYEVNFVNPSPKAVFKGSNKRSYHHNYFLGSDQSKWKGKVPLYGEIQIESLYPGIDAKIYSTDLSLKYDFIVRPNTSPDKIQLKFNGVNPVLLPSGDLQIVTSVNEVVENKPYSYQIIEGKKITVPSKYNLKKNVLSFEFPEGYNKNYELVIDPTLIFATYSGSIGAAAYSYTTTYDEGGSLYAGADSWAQGWPVTVGAFQTVFAFGAHDVGVNKYTPNGGNLIYSTYYGGSGADYPHSMFVTPQGQLVVIGSTTSSNLPVTVGCYDNTYNGGTDMFIARFNDQGSDLVGATYFGTSVSEPWSFTMNSTTTSITGQNTTSPLEINVDANGNVWGVANTTSAAFPVTANAVQPTFGGAMDGVVFQFDPTLSNLLYSTYLGGSGDDAPFAIQFNSQGNVIVGGVTQSTNFPTTANVLHTTNQGGMDGFVTVINQNTGAIMASTFIGTSSTDQVVNLQVDELDNIFILGRTLGNYPISPNVYNTANGDVFIDKITSDLTTSLLSTRIGTAQTNTTRYFPTAFLLDNCQNVYVAGLGSSSSGGQATMPSGMPLTLDAFSTVANNFYFIALQPNFSDILFGSYYGSGNDHTHVGVNRLDPSGNVYHSVCSASSSWPTTAGSYSPTKLNGSGQDIVSFKFDFEANGVKAHLGLPPTTNDSGCVPFTVTFENTSTSPYGMTYSWNFGDGGTSTQGTPTYTFVTPGVYDVILHAHSDSACITDSWDTMRITVLETNVPIISIADTSVCGQVNSINLTVDIANPSSNNIITWGPSVGIIGPNDQATVEVNPSVNDVYYVIVKDTIPGICGFSSRDTIQINYAPRSLNILTNDTIVCKGTTVKIRAEGTDEFDYIWSPTTGVNNPTTLEPQITVNQSITYTLTGSHDGCPDTSQTITIQVQEIPVVDLGPDMEFCEGQEVMIEPNISPYRNDYTYEWIPGSGLQNSGTANNSFIADTSITYVLNVSTPIGCKGSDTVSYTINPLYFGDIIADTGYCPPDSVQLWASGGISYSWSPSYGLSNPNIAQPKAKPASSTDYSVVIKNQKGCIDTQFVKVQVYPLAVLNMPDVATIYSGEEYQIEPQTNALYFSWFPPSGMNNTAISNPTVNPEVRTRYFVTATTEHGCEIKDSIDILVKDFEIDMPNAFTPGNGINNTIKAPKRGIVQLKEFSVFNRWGNKVFSTTNIDEGWDGSFNGTPQPAGVYIYMIDAVSKSGKPFKKQGNITLLR